MFVVAPGRMRIRVLFDTTAHADTELNVQAPAGGKIVGRVTGMDGKPIPGAYVGMSGSGSYWSMNGLYMACDAEGRFDYEAVDPPNQLTGLNAAAPGYVEEQRGALFVSSDKPVGSTWSAPRRPPTRSLAPRPLTTYPATRSGAPCRAWSVGRTRSR